MSALEKILRLAGSEHVEGYQRKTKFGIQKVSAYTRSPGDMSDQELLDEIDQLTNAAPDKTDRIANARARTRKIALEREVSQRQRNGTWQADQEAAPGAKPGFGNGPISKAAAEQKSNPLGGIAPPASQQGENSGPEHVVAAKEAIDNVDNLLDSLRQEEGDNGPRGWDDQMDEWNGMATAIRDALKKGDYDADPQRLQSDLEDLAQELKDNVSTGQNQELVDEVSQQLLDASDSAASNPASRIAAIRERRSGAKAGLGPKMVEKQPDGSYKPTKEFAPKDSSADQGEQPKSKVGQAIDKAKQAAQAQTDSPEHKAQVEKDMKAGADKVAAIRAKHASNPDISGKTDDDTAGLSPKEKELYDEFRQDGDDHEEALAMAKKFAAKQEKWDAGQKDWEAKNPLDPAKKMTPDDLKAENKAADLKAAGYGGKKPAAAPGGSSGGAGKGPTPNAPGAASGRSGEPADGGKEKPKGLDMNSEVSARKMAKEGGTMNATKDAMEKATGAKLHGHFRGDNTDNGSNKYWESAVIEHPDGTATHSVKFGKRGQGAAGGQHKVTHHPDVKSAQAAHEKQSNAKRKTYSDDQFEQASRNENLVDHFKKAGADKPQASPAQDKLKEKTSGQPKWNADETIGEPDDASPTPTKKFSSGPNEEPSKAAATKPGAGKSSAKSIDDHLSALDKLKEKVGGKDAAPSNFSDEEKKAYAAYIAKGMSPAEAKAAVQKGSGGGTGGPDHPLPSSSSPGSKKTPDKYFTLHSGQYNPVKKTGSGAEYTHDAGGIAILGDSSGKQLRAVSGASYDNPEQELGRAIEQSKQGANSDTVKSGLRLLGYVDKQGNFHGYVPDRHIQFFVMK